MIGEIVNAFCGEIKALFENSDNVEYQGATILRDTQFKPDEMQLHTMPVVVLSLTSGLDVRQLPGGCTQAEWGWLLKVYFYDAGSELDELYSAQAYDVIDFIRRHFTFQEWITDEFKAVVETYSYKLTLMSTVPADSLADDGGICPSYQITFDSIAIDAATSFVQLSEHPLEFIEQTPINT